MTRLCVRSLAIKAAFAATIVPVIAVGAPPNVQFVTTETLIRHDGVIDWNDFNLPVPAQVPVHGISALSATITQQHNSPFGMGRITQDPHSPSTGGFWGGSFAPGETLLWTGFGSNGPMTLKFSSPVSQAGMQIQGGWYGTFVAELKAFDPQGTLIGSFSRTGLSADTADNSAPFIGVRSDQLIISTLVIDVAPYSNFGHYFAIDGPIVSLAVVPEPSSYIYFAAGLISLISVRRKQYLVSSAVSRTKA